MNHFQIFPAAQRFIFLFSISVLLATPIWSQEKVPYKYAYTTAPSGLRMRAEPSLKAANIITLPLNTKVEIIERKKDQDNIDDRNGYWTKVKATVSSEKKSVTKEGWVFDGYLCPLLDQRGAFIVHMLDSWDDLHPEAIDDYNFYNYETEQYFKKQSIPFYIVKSDYLWFQDTKGKDFSWKTSKYKENIILYVLYEPGKKPQVSEIPMVPVEAQKYFGLPEEE